MNNERPMWGKKYASLAYSAGNIKGDRESLYAQMDLIEWVTNELDERRRRRGAGNYREPREDVDTDNPRRRGHHCRRDADGH